MLWSKLWEARVGEKMDAAMAQVWEDEMDEEVRNLKPSEIISGVRAIAEDKRKGKIKYKPTLNHLISAIIRNRYQTEHGGSPAQMQTTSEARVNELRARIRTALETGDKIAAWIAICHHPDTGELMDAEMWAIERFGFERPTFEEMGLKPLTQVMRELASGTMQMVAGAVCARAKGPATA